MAAVCLWGQRAEDAVPAADAILTGDSENDYPDTAMIPASEAVPPAREQAAASVNGLVVGVYENFHVQAFGPVVPASNFSVSAESGAPDRAPSFGRILVTR
jgi:hypothetical protein